MKRYLIDPDSYVKFNNHVDDCIGTGRMGLALQQEYLEQLRLVQKEIGFKHIRGHGLFCDDMAIYQEYTDEEGNVRAEYNFTYLDRVMDAYRELGLAPFLELGFMPTKLASGTQTVFYWKGNTTPPSNMAKWCALVQETLRHLMNRYGTDEVVTWPVEVWNEPNLPFFWEGASKEKYFELFQSTFYAIKEVDSRFRIGGPAVCGGSDEEWIQAFMEYCNKLEIPVDFVTRHHYTTDVPQPDGHYGYVNLSNPEDGFKNLQTTRDIIDSFDAYRGLKIYVTEFNTSYIPNCPLHDTNLNAAYIALQLSRLGDVNESYSYWTFGDVFEENGVPFSPFHGGFGLVANGCIPKPTFWTFSFFKQLTGSCVFRSDDTVIMQKENGNYVGIIWNNCMDEKKQKDVEYVIPTTPGEQYVLLTKRVDEEVCNPLKVWHDLGEPSSLSHKELKILKDSAEPLLSTEQMHAVHDSMNICFSLLPNGVTYFELSKVTCKPDRGYDWNKVMKIQDI